METKKENTEMVVLWAIADIAKEKGKDEPISSSEIQRYVVGVMMKNISLSSLWRAIRKLEEKGYLKRYSVIPRYRNQGLPKNLYEISEEGYEKLKEWQKSDVVIV